MPRQTEGQQKSFSPKSSRSGSADSATIIIQKLRNALREHLVRPSDKTSNNLRILLYNTEIFGKRPNGKDTVRSIILDEINKSGNSSAKYDYIDKLRRASRLENGLGVEIGTYSEGLLRRIGKLRHMERDEVFLEAGRKSGNNIPDEELLQKTLYEYNKKKELKFQEIPKRMNTGQIKDKIIELAAKLPYNEKESIIIEIRKTLPIENKNKLTETILYMGKKATLVSFIDYIKKVIDEKEKS